MYLKRVCFMIFGCLMLTACMNNQSEIGLAPSKDQPIELTKLKANSPLDQQPANKAKQILSNYDEIKSVRAVNHNQELLIGLQLNHHDRFRLEDIEKDLKEKIRKDFSEMDVSLSTDEKIHLEVKKLEKAIQEDSISKEKLTKRIKKIKKLSSEET